MEYRVVSVQHVQGYVLHLVFADGAEGDVDLSGDLEGEVFEPLRDVALFSQAYLHPELRTVVWPGGADLAPEFLRQRMRVNA